VITLIARSSRSIGCCMLHSIHAYRSVVGLSPRPPTSSQGAAAAMGTTTTQGSMGVLDASLWALDVARPLRKFETFDRSYTVICSVQCLSSIQLARCLWRENLHIMPLDPANPIEFIDQLINKFYPIDQ
jgi:hypothetical protein